MQSMLKNKSEALQWVIVGGLIFMETSAFAQATSTSSFFTGWKNSINALIELVILASVLAGVSSVLYGLFQLVKKGMGRGEDVEWRQVLWPLAGGALLTVLMYVISLIIADGGGATTDIGRGYTTTP